MNTSASLHDDSPEVAAQNQLRDIATALQSAEAAVTTGQLVTLTSIAADIEQFCAAVPKMPPPVARRLLPTIEAIMTKLDSLAAQLQARGGNLGSDNGAVRQRAADAYRRRRD
ncbi:MAG: hypothetical protein VW057_11245 [Rhodospirillaceae bacterium]